MSNAEVLAALRRRAAAIDAVMEEDLKGVRSPLLGQVLRQALFQGGKRIRPLLTLLAASLRGEAPADTARLAIAFEYLHAASLIHDDIIDHAELRRGQKTAHLLWGEAAAILAGDFLHARALELAGTVGGRQGVAAIGQATAAMVEAEFLQMQTAREQSSTEGNYFQVLLGKTAALIAAACEAGVDHAQGSPADRAALRTYGANLGLAFQIVDDLLDFTGDARVLGKPVLTDLGEGRITLPLIHALKKADRSGRARLKALVGRKDISAAERRELLALLAGTGSFDRARERAREFTERALERIDAFPDSPPRETLIRLAVYGLTRSR